MKREKNFDLKIWVYRGRDIILYTFTTRRL